MRFNNRQMINAISELTVPATNSTGSLRLVLGASSYTGRMPTEFAAEYVTACRENMISHTVMSYATPIAWRYHGGRWTVPDTRYSVTTSKHQGIVHAAISE